MLIVAILLIALGLVVSLLGLTLFRILLPIIGLISGFMVGFTGVQAIFGTGVVSTVIALVIAVSVGVLMAILSYAFFDLAVIIFAGVLGAAVFSYLGVALGLDNDGFLVFMLGLAGAIVGAVAAASTALSVQLVVAFTALAGVAYVLAGIFLVAGSVTLDGLNETGIMSTIVDVVDQSFLWLIVWFGAALVAMRFQYVAAMNQALNNPYAFQPKKK